MWGLGKCSEVLCLKKKKKKSLKIQGILLSLELCNWTGRLFLKFKNYWIELGRHTIRWFWKACKRDILIRKQGVYQSQRFLNLYKPLPQIHLRLFSEKWHFKARKKKISWTNFGIIKCFDINLNLESVVLIKVFPLCQRLCQSWVLVGFFSITNTYYYHF